MDEVTYTILEQPNNMGFGGLGLGQQTQQEPDIDISMLG